MGQKINATGFRIGPTIDWKSKWFHDKASYGKFVIEDEKIREFFKKSLPTAGLQDVIIERSLNDLTITLKVSRPGVVIGKGGAGVNLLREELSKLVKSKLSISVEEVKRPEMSAKLIADSLTHQIERRVHYRRAILSAIEKAKSQGVKGIKIIASGVLSGGNTIARTEPYTYGSIPQSTIKANLDYGEAPAKTVWGVIGIRVWVYK